MVSLDFTTISFVEQHGLHGLQQLLRMLNDGATLTQLAHVFNMPRSSIGRIKNIITEKKYVLRQAALDCLEYKSQQAVEHSKEFQSAINQQIHEQAEFKLIIGGLNALAHTQNSSLKKIL